MYWDEVQKRALKEGCLVYAMDQSQTGPCTMPGPWGVDQGGYCGGLAMRWIALHYVGSDYPHDARTKECDNPGWEASRDQAIYESGNKSFPDEYKKIAAQYGLTLNKGSVKESGLIARPLVQAANEFRGCCILSLRGKDGHAVAIGRSPEYKSGFFFFDSNYGSFIFRNVDETVKFLGWYFTETKYSQKFPVVRLAGVNAPPFVSGELKAMVAQGWKLG